MVDWLFYSTKHKYFSQCSIKPYILVYGFGNGIYSGRIMPIYAPDLWENSYTSLTQPNIRTHMCIMAYE